MMELTRKGEYAIRGIVFLAKQPAGRVILVSEVAEATGVSQTFLAKIFQSFVGALKCRRDGFLDRDGGGASEFDVFVDLVFHDWAARERV